MTSRELFQKFLDSSPLFRATFDWDVNSVTLEGAGERRGYLGFVTVVEFNDDGSLHSFGAYE